MADISALRKQVLFSELTDVELGTIAKKILLESYAKNTPIFREGEPTKGIFLIRSGKVEISKATPDGWKQTLAVISEDNMFGELSVIEDKRTHGADATAIEATDVFWLKTDDFKAFERTDTTMMYKVMKAMARIASKSVHSMNEKLLKALISY